MSIKLVFVHRYKYSHESKRKKYRKLLKNKEVKLVKRTSTGFWYEVTQ